MYVSYGSKHFAYTQLSVATVQTGALTSAFALLDLFVYLFIPVSHSADICARVSFKRIPTEQRPVGVVCTVAASRSYFDRNFIWDFPLSKLYTVSLISTSVYLSN